MSPLVPFILPISPGVLPVTLMIRYIVFLPIILPPDDTWCSRDPVSSWCLPRPSLTPPSSTPRRQPQARKPIIHCVSPQIKNIWTSALCSIFKTHLSVKLELFSSGVVILFLSPSRVKRNCLTPYAKNWPLGLWFNSAFPQGAVEMYQHNETGTFSRRK